MRMHYPLCVLLVAVQALVTAAVQTNNCIVGCKCDGDVPNARKLKISDCDSPLVLTQDALLSISKKITTVQFKNVVITRIEKEAFAAFDELEAVIIEDSSIGSIDTTAFDLPELGTINFIKTTFGEIPSLTSEYLEELIFNDCKLSQVPNLDHVQALSFLNLANNLIETIDEATFLAVDSLEEVTLSNNSISKLPPNLFFTNRDFNTLNLDYNPLKTFNLNFGSELEFLSLRYCNLSTFDRQTSKNLTSLTSLDLAGNQISVLPIDAFETMKDLTYLDLSNNKLVELDDDIFLENSKLDKIVLNDNQFDALPNFQTKARTFQTFTLSCKNCGLKSINNAFENMKGLVTLDLSNNNIDNIEGAFTEMHGLKQLFLSNNKITTIGATAFSKDSQLETLDLSNNPLLPLDPVAFATISSLKKLNISNSNLYQLWANHNANLPSLERLLVENNHLTILTVADVKVAPKLKILNLKGNSLICTEDLNDVVELFVTKSIYPMDTGLFTTHEELKSGSDEPRGPKRSWQAVLDPDCTLDTFNEDDIDSELADDDEDENDSDNDLNYDMDYSTETQQDIAVEESILDSNGFNLARASYILSITSVFILTALLVLVVAVVVTLLILKRNKSFNMHNGNLPRLKIPLWHTTLGQKKHSGSIYRPLSEELSGSRTPIINRYEFKQTPQVHNSIS